MSGGGDGTGGTDSSSAGEAGAGALGGAGGAAGSDDGGTGGQPWDPQGLWTLSVVAAEVPPTKPDGLSWDASGPFEAPDPFARVRAGSADGEAHDSTSPEDTFFPTWIPSEQLVTASASELLAYVGLELWDEDLSFHDLIGSCVLELSEQEFDGSPKKFECTGTDGEQLFTLTYQLDHAQ